MHGAAPTSGAAARSGVSMSGSSAHTAYSSRIGTCSVAAQARANVDQDVRAAGHDDLLDAGAPHRIEDVVDDRPVGHRLERGDLPRSARAAVVTGAVREQQNTLLRHVHVTAVAGCYSRAGSRELHVEVSDAVFVSNPMGRKFATKARLSVIWPCTRSGTGHAFARFCPSGASGQASSTVEVGGNQLRLSWRSRDRYRILLLFAALAVAVVCLASRGARGRRVRDNR